MLSGAKLNNTSGVKRCSYQAERPGRKPSLADSPKCITLTICERGNVLFREETIIEKWVVGLSRYVFCCCSINSSFIVSPKHQKPDEPKHCRLC